MADYPEWFLKRIQSIKNKRPRIVAEHILKHGSVTTEELKNIYGYNHAPRAARDLREMGIPLETARIKNSEGRSIGTYRFGDLDSIRGDRLKGRTIFSKRFKAELLQVFGSKCSICHTPFEARYLQIDHRVPYEVAGDQDDEERKLQDYTLLCGECNRAKSWSCEHCHNWTDEKNSQICLTCYWAHPEAYSHIALRQIRRVDIVWNEAEVEDYERLNTQADDRGESVPDYVKKILKKLIDAR